MRARLLKTLNYPLHGQSVDVMQRVDQVRFVSLAEFHLVNHSLSWSAWLKYPSDLEEQLMVAGIAVASTDGDRPQERLDDQADRSVHWEPVMDVRTVHLSDLV